MQHMWPVANDPILVWCISFWLKFKKNLSPISLLKLDVLSYTITSKLHNSIPILTKKGQGVISFQIRRLIWLDRGVRSNLITRQLNNYINYRSYVSKCKQISCWLHFMKYTYLNDPFVNETHIVLKALMFRASIHGLINPKNVYLK